MCGLLRIITVPRITEITLGYEPWNGEFDSPGMVQTMKNYVKYKDWLLAKKSEAYELYASGELQKLDKHLKQLETNERELLKRYV